MNTLNNLFPKNLYHSYVVEGNPETTTYDLLKFLKDRGEIESKSPDVFLKIYDSFTMDDSSKVKEWHAELGISGTKKICIIGANFINHDAERTLLKIIEEPAENTHFFLVVPNASILLDTIRSRTHIIITPKKGNDIFKKNAQEFILSNSKNRVDFINKMIRKYKNIESNSKLRNDAILFINEIEKIIFEKFKLDRSNKKIRFVLEEIQEKRKYLNLPGASVKMILEHLAIVL